MAMTVGEHDSLWKAGAKSLQHIPEIAQSLRRQNAIKIMEISAKKKYRDS